MGHRHPSFDAAFILASSSMGTCRAKYCDLMLNEEEGELQKVPLTTKEVPLAAVLCCLLHKLP
jgi:hypothetical protein